MTLTDDKLKELLQRAGFINDHSPYIAKGGLGQFQNLLRLNKEQEDKVTAIVRAFIDEHKISCGEAVHQKDEVIINAYGFIVDLCEVVGYYQYKESEA